MQKIDFLFEYEVKQRELDSVCLIAAYLQKKGYTVAFVNSWQAMYERIPKYDAEVMVLSACYNDDVYNAFTNMAARFKKVVNLQWEQVLTGKMYQPHDEVFGDFQGNGLITRHVCWGENEKRWLSEFCKIDPSYTKVLGCPIQDFYRKEFESLLIPKEALFSQFQIDPQKNTLLFVSSFSSVDLPDTEIFGDASVWEDTIKSAYRSQQVILKWFEQLLQEHPEFQLVYRYHPAEKSNPSIKKLSQKYPNFYAISEYPIRHWVAACDKLLNWCSTSLIEMYCSGKETYLLRPVDVLPKDDIIIFQDARAIRTYDELVRSLQNYPGFPVPDNSILKWYSITNTPAFQRIGDWLIETYHDSGYSSPPTKGVSQHSAFSRELAGIVRDISVRLGIPSLADKVLPNSRLSQYLQGMAESAAHQKEKMDKSGYMYEKYRQNALKPGEAEALMEMYRSLQ